MKAKEEADNWFKKSLELTNRLVELASSPFNLDLFALSCYRYGCFLSDFDLLGRDLLEAAMRIWEQLSHQHPDDPHYARFAEIAKGAICNYFSTDYK